MAKNDDRVQSIKLTDKDTDKTYELDFNRDAVRFAEARGFQTEDVAKYPNTKVPELFYYSFRMHHREIAKNQTDAILEKMGGVTGAALERLILLYEQAALANVMQTEEDAAKNSKVTMEL